MKYAEVRTPIVHSPIDTSGYKTNPQKKHLENLYAIHDQSAQNAQYQTSAQKVMQSSHETLNP
jgi:hypothetical protein